LPFPNRKVSAESEIKLETPAPLNIGSAHVSKFSVGRLGKRVRYKELIEGRVFGFRLGDELIDALAGNSVEGGVDAACDTEEWAGLRSENR